MTYVEFPSDHKFSQFLARMTPAKALKDRTSMFSKQEKQLDRFFIRRNQIEEAELTRVAMEIWRKTA